MMRNIGNEVPLVRELAAVLSKRSSPDHSSSEPCPA